MAAHGEELEDESVDEGTSSDCAPSATTPFFRRAKSKVPDVADTSLLDRATGLVNRQRREYAEITRGYGVYDVSYNTHIFLFVWESLSAAAQPAHPPAPGAPPVAELLASPSCCSGWPSSSLA